MLENVRVLVVGGGTGIGRAAAQALAAEGAQVCVAGRRLDRLQETAAVRPEKIRCQTLDVASQASVQAVVAELEQAWGGIDILINCSGTNVRKRALAELSSADWNGMLAVNASGAFYSMAAALTGMRARKNGLIIHVGSVAGKRASLLGGVGYSASKFALTALAMTAALEEGKHGIRVTLIHPGEVNTPLLEQRPVPVSEEHKARILQPEDVAAAVVMICKLPPRAHISELIIKPTTQDYA